MKVLVATVFVVLVVSAFAKVEPEWVEIDWSKVVPVKERPGFWDGRDVKPIFHPRDRSRDGRIVGGLPAAPHSIPYQAQLIVNFGGAANSLCGGCVISTTRTLTAAHCVEDRWIQSQSTQVILGAHQLNVVEPSQQRFTVLRANYRVHPQWNDVNFNNDIAVLILSTPATFNLQVQPVALAAGTETFVGFGAAVSGWGRPSDRVIGNSQVLRVVMNPVISNQVCARTYLPGVVIDSTLCTSAANGRGPCVGDSGGPLTVFRNGASLLIGVVSFGYDSTCERGFPNAYARVTYYNQWIQAQ